MQKEVASGSLSKVFEAHYNVGRHSDLEGGRRDCYAFDSHPGPLIIPGRVNARLQCRPTLALVDYVRLPREPQLLHGGDRGGESSIRTFFRSASATVGNIIS